MTQALFRPLRHQPLLVLGIGDLELPNSRADSRVLIGRFHVADQGGGAGLEAGNAPAEEALEGYASA